MRANSPGAFMLSLTLHGAIVAIVLFFTFAMHTQVKEQPKIFELVAGEGDNYMATEAPALGTPGVKLNVPTPQTPAPALKPEPQPEPEQSPPEPGIEKKPKGERRKIQSTQHTTLLHFDVTQLRETHKLQSDDHSVLVPHLPIPNRTVKRDRANDSAHSCVKVGHRQTNPSNPLRNSTRQGVSHLKTNRKPPLNPSGPGTSSCSCVCTIPT